MFKALAIAGVIAAVATGSVSQAANTNRTPASSAGSALRPSLSVQRPPSTNSPRSLTQAGTLVFADTFEQDSLNSPARGWSTLSGSFSVCQPPGKTHEYCQTSPAVGGAIPNVTGSNSWTDYQLDADLVHGSNTGAISLVARMSDARHFYSFQIRSSAGSTAQIWQLWKYDGRWTELLGHALTIAAGQNVHVRLVLSGSLITAYAGSQASSLVRLGAAVDRTFPSGGIGISTQGTSNSTFDNVTVNLASGNPAPSPTPNQSGVATYAGCPIFTPGDYFNEDVTSAAVDPASQSYLSSLEAVDNTGFQPALGIEPLNIADDTTPVYTVRPRVSWHSFSVKYPWQNGYQIETASDAHYVAVNKQTCHLYESYGTSFSGNVFSAYSGKDYDLHQPFKIGVGVMASGLSIFAGAVRHEEIATGIHHALNLDVWQNALCNCYVAPAAASDGVPYNGPSSAYEMPYGAHIRLKASFDCSHWGPQSSAICTAMKHYGLLVADTDGHYTNNNKLFFVNPTDGGSWNSGDLAVLSNLRFADFDVLDVGNVKH